MEKTKIVRMKCATEISSLRFVLVDLKPMTVEHATCFILHCLYIISLFVLLLLRPCEASYNAEMLRSVRPDSPRSDQMSAYTAKPAQIDSLTSTADLTV